MVARTNLDLPNRGRAVAFDVDADSLASLRQAFPEWTIDALTGASTKSLVQDWDPKSADLLIVGTHTELAETLGLCRGLRSQAGRAHTPLLVLVPPEQEAMVSAVLEAGADSCLVLPVHSKSLVSMLANVWAGNQPGRHTLGLEQAQRENKWQDEGGEA